MLVLTYKSAYGLRHTRHSLSWLAQCAKTFNGKTAPKTVYWLEYYGPRWGDGTGPG
jgi:hypothetical protein